MKRAQRLSETHGLGLINWTTILTYKAACGPGNNALVYILGMIK